MHLNLGSKQRYYIFGMVSLALLSSSISTSSAAVALSPIIDDLNTSLILTGWVISSYQLIFAAVQPLAGKISDVLGRKSTLLLCTLLFTVGSVLCATSPNIYALIASRIIQATGGGGFLPCAAGIVADEFPKSRQRAIGLFTGIFPIGTIIGPNVGGLLIESFGWRAIFWFNAPLGAVILLLAWLLMRADKKKSVVGIDYIGAALLLGILFSFMTAFTQLGQVTTGIPWTSTILLFILSGIILFFFIRREKHVAQPIVDMEIIREKPFLATNVYNLIYGISSLGISSIAPLYAVSVYGMSAFESGLILTPRSIAMIITSTVTSIYILKWGYRKPILIGTLMVIMALFFLAMEPQGMQVAGLKLNSTVLILTIMGISGAGIGIAGPASNNACIELMPDKVATIVGLRGMFRQVGQAMCVAVATVVLNIKGNMFTGFNVVFILMAVVALISVPTIFIMPGHPETKAKTTAPK